MPLFSNTTGFANTAFGWYALFGNTVGSNNTAVGAGAGDLNTTGNNNTAVGTAALLFNTAGGDNTAIGVAALELNLTGINNTANGAFALFNITGNGNIALGANAGVNLTTGDNNIDIGNIGVAGESSMIRIGDPAVHEGIFLGGITAMTAEAPNQAVLVDPTTGQLGSVDVGSLLEYAIVTVFVDRGNGPSRWAFYSAPLGSPAGTTTGGVFRFSCSADQAPCKISYGAAVVSNQSTANAVIHPRLLINKQDGSSPGHPSPSARTRTAPTTTRGSPRYRECRRWRTPWWQCKRLSTWGSVGRSIVAAASRFPLMG